MKTIERKPIQLVKVLKADANGKLPDVIELARVGEWHTAWHGDFILNVEDFDQAIEQFNAGIYRVNGTEPLAGTLDHLGGDSPAAFRINRLYRDGEALMAGVSWTALGKEKLERDEYRYVSFEYCPRSMPFENPEKAGDMWVNVLTGATLTNDPLFKKLKPVMASVKGGGDNNKGESMTIEELRAKELAELNDAEKAFLKEHQAELTDEERTKFEIVDDAAAKKAQEEADAKAAAEKEAADKAAAEKAEAEKLEASTKGMSKEQKAAFASLQASVAQLQAKAEAGERAEKELLKTRLTASVTAHVNRGAIKSGELDSTVEMLLASSDSVRESQLAFIDKLPDNPAIATERGKATVQASVVTVTSEELAMGEAFNLTPEQIKEFKEAQAKEGK